MYKYIKYLPCAFLIAFVIKFMFIPVIYAEAIVFAACAALYAYHLIREDKSKEESEALEQRFQDLTDELGHMNNEMVQIGLEAANKVDMAKEELKQSLKVVEDLTKNVSNRFKLDQQVISKKKRHF